MKTNELEQQQEVGSMGTLSAALEFASLGWPAFPCQERGKHPLTAHGYKDASSDAKQIRRWWSQWPNANVAIRTGKESGVVVLDVDGQEGEASLESLEAKHGPLPATVEAITPNGRHLYFKYPGWEVRCFVGMLGSGLDIRGDGGYVIVSPSIHPSGKPYTWKPGHSPEEIPLAEMPT